MEADLISENPNWMTDALAAFINQVAKHPEMESHYERHSEVLFSFLVQGLIIYTESMMAQGATGPITQYSTLAQAAVDEAIMANPAILAIPGAAFQMMAGQTLVALGENLDAYSTADPPDPQPG